MEWIVVGIGVIFLISIGVGIYRGAIKIIVSLVATVLTLALTVFLTPYAAKAVTKYTPIDEVIQRQVTHAMSNVVMDMNILTPEGEDTGTEEQEVKGLDEASIKKVLDAAGISEEKLNEYGYSIQDIIDGKLNVNDYQSMGISDKVFSGLKAGQDVIESTLMDAEIPRELQMKAIENAELPQSFKTLLTANNNEEGYRKLGVETFGQYVAKFLSNLLINIIAFLAVFLLITILFRAILFALDVVSTLPVLGFANRLAGGVLGAVGALVIVWFIFILVSLLFAAGVGKEVYYSIQDNSILSLIYNSNPIMKIAVKFI
ncbi:putative membrane protein required for colicin V production [Aequitasia blattaphilus]|uniref:CvpA family protein n=1 Tax=Aequitasia blattaphilus TaxID=2949332 RepID=A0ABT1EA77_9FIRM|nr:CvpA family protein [Aequitasia blattaphilus]MCP1102581.1 CvpA family protein [Aequitasia blattaphilus]MCR8615221.1 CvpA family protein [Aequitasia blattaphilus]